MANQPNLFPGALADLYSRGMDISRDNPWALAASAFPGAMAARPGITMEDVVSQARDFFNGRTSVPQPAAGGVPAPDNANANMPMPEIGGGSAGGAMGPNAGVPSVTGFDPGLAGLGAGFLSLGVTGPAFAGALTPSLLSANQGLAAGKTVSGLAGRMGLTPSPNLQATIDDQTVPATALYSGALGRLGIPSQFAAANPANLNMQGITPSQLAAIANSPEFMMTQEVSPLVMMDALRMATPTLSGWADTSQLTKNVPPPAGNRDVNAPSPTAGGPTSPGEPAGPDSEGPPGSVSVGAIGVSDPSDPGAGNLGEPGSTAPGEGPGPSDGTGGPGDTGGFKKGGYVTKKGKSAPQHGEKFHPGFNRAKGTSVVPIKAHEGEFVTNAKATDKFRPVLEAMNDAVPDSGKRLDSTLAKAKKFFDV